jgi:hypothetical protein
MIDGTITDAMTAMTDITAIVSINVKAAVVEGEFALTPDPPPGGRARGGNCGPIEISRGPFELVMFRVQFVRSMRDQVSAADFLLLKVPLGLLDRN